MAPEAAGRANRASERRPGGSAASWGALGQRQIGVDERRRAFAQGQARQQHRLTGAHRGAMHCEGGAQVGADAISLLHLIVRRVVMARDPMQMRVAVMDVDKVGIHGTHGLERCGACVAGMRFIMTTPAPRAHRPRRQRDAQQQKDEKSYRTCHAASLPGVD